MARNPATIAILLTTAAVALVVGCGLTLRAATTSPCESYVSYSDQLNDKYGTFEDVARLSWLTPNEDRKLHRFHIACNEYDPTHPGAWDDAVGGQWLSVPVAGLQWRPSRAVRC
jgi:hypothetical protein